MLARKRKGYVYLEGDRIARESKVKLYRFWDLLAHTKLIEWGKQFAGLSRYMEKNLAQAEAVGTILITDGMEIRAG